MGPQFVQCPWYKNLFMIEQSKNHIKVFKQVLIFSVFPAPLHILVVRFIYLKVYTAVLEIVLSLAHTLQMSNCKLAVNA